jgi:hypothetical protein
MLLEQLDFSDNKFQKFIVTGIEKVCDVIEAIDEEAALKIFRAKYPAIFQITNIKIKNKE